MELTRRNPPANRDGRVWRRIAFPLTFVLSAGSMLALTACLPESLQNMFRDAVMLMTKWLGTITGLSVINRGEIMSVNGFDMRIITHCTAIHYLVIIISAMLASRWHTFSRRITGIACAIPLLMFFNAVRLLMTGLAGALSPHLFHFVHNYLWVTLFLLLTLLIWVVWDRWPGNRIRFSYKTLHLLGWCTLFQLLLCQYGQQVLNLLVRVAAAMATGIPGLSGISIASLNGKVVFLIGALSFSGSFDGESTVLAVYAGIAITEIMAGGIRKAAPFCVGGVIVLFCCSGIIAMCAPIMLHWGTAGAVPFLWVSQGMMLALPLVVWWLAERISRHNVTSRPRLIGCPSDAHEGRDAFSG